MTKSEFAREAGKAGLRPQLYGMILSGRVGAVAGGKVVGIEWRDGWKTEMEYSPMWGRELEKKFLGKEPYVILRKDRKSYAVEAWRVAGYVDGKVGEWLAGKAKAGEAL